MNDQRPIRVVQLVAGVAIGDQASGAEYFGLQLARHLDRPEFEPVILAMWRYNSVAEQKWLEILSHEGLPVTGLTTVGRYPLFDLGPILARLWAFTSAFKPDIINSHSQRGDLLAALVHLLHPHHPRAVRTVHIDQPWLNRRYTDLVFDKVLFPLLFNVEVAISQTVRFKLDNRLLARLVGKKSVLCYNGIDARFFSPEFAVANRGELPAGVPDVRPRLGVIGRMTRQKGLPYLVQALHLMNQQRAVHLMVIGTGPLETEIEQQVQALGLGERVHFLGSRNDVMRILPHLDMVVSSSLWEGLPTVLLEAMALHVPVVATDVSGSREIVCTGQTGILVPPQDPARLAEAILWLLDRPAEARAMAHNAHRVAADYTVQNTATRYAELYRRLAKKKTS
ncbi:MAG: glycosyltransferase [Chloroflexota bacterium]